MSWNDFLSTNDYGLLGMAAGWFAVLFVWSLIWKGLALWRAARRSDKVWFVVFLIVNTLGILEIVYYFLIAKNEKIEKK